MSMIRLLLGHVLLAIGILALTCAIGFLLSC